MKNDESDSEKRVIPVVGEELVVSKRSVKTGSVKVEKHVDFRTESITMPLIRQTVDVKRVAVNREITSMPETRTIGATTIIPVVEEEIVVTRRLMLLEEIHMTKHYSRDESTKKVQVGTERAEVLRMDAEGRVIDKQDAPGAGRRIIKRKSYKTE